MSQGPTQVPTRREGLFSAKIVRHIELSVAVALSLSWILFRIRFFLHAGALWRDEVVSFNLSNAPHFAKIWRNLQFDSFPILWPAILRLWIHLGLGTTDPGLRLFGLIVGIAILAAILLAARTFRIGPPIISLALLGFNAALICSGDSIRSYGLGVLLEILTLALIWQLVDRPTLPRIALTFIVALAAVHALFYNSVLLGAMCGSAMLVTFLHRQPKRAAVIGAIGIICAASMAIYKPVIARRDAFGEVFRFPPEIRHFISKFAESVSFDITTDAFNSRLNFAAWVMAFVLAVYAGAFMLGSTASSDQPRRSLAIYLMTTLIAGSFGYYAMLLKLSYLTEPWYYLALLVLWALCADGLLATLNRPRLQLIIYTALVMFCCANSLRVWADSGLRKTNVDTIAADLSRDAGKDDLVIVVPWYFGVSFIRYYTGPAPVITVLPGEALDYQRYDLLIAAMQNPHVMDSIIARAQNVLRSGHSVFILGGFDEPQNNYPTAAPAPHSALGWNDTAYYHLWHRQLTFAVLRHAISRTDVPTPHQGISDFERPALVQYTGWRETPASHP